MVIPDRPPANGFVAGARKIYNPVGFSKGYNFVLWFIFLGAFFGFTLARLQYLDFYGVFCPPDGTSPTGSQAASGECFYWFQGHYTVGIIMHLAGILPAALLACIQFIPVIRHKAIIIHRVNGYMVILLSFIATAGALMVTRRAFGGDLSTQMIAGALSIAFIWALAMAYINIKRLQIEEHRAWMLRAWFWAGCIITTRLIQIIAVSILPMTGTYYNAQPCDKIDWTLTKPGYGNHTQDSIVASYPECSAFYSGANLGQYTVVKADLSNAADAMQAGAALDIAFGASLWLAFALHVLGVELYLHLTPAETERLRKVSYQRQLEAGMKHPGRAGLTSDRFGDASE